MAKTYKLRSIAENRIGKFANKSHVELNSNV